MISLASQAVWLSGNLRAYATHADMNKPSYKESRAKGTEVLRGETPSHYYDIVVYSGSQAHHSTMATALARLMFGFIDAKTPESVVFTIYRQFFLLRVKERQDPEADWEYAA